MDKEEESIISTTLMFDNTTVAYYDYSVPPEYDYNYPYGQLDLPPADIDRANRISKSFNALFRSSSDDWTLRMTVKEFCMI